MPPRTSKRRTAKYVVNATFRMVSPRLSKGEADKIARSARRKGGTVTIKKV